MRKYYEAYDDRYRQVHEENLRWFAETPSPIVEEIMSEFSMNVTDKMLEIGCGEGRDAVPLLKRGFDLLATDISPEAVSWCVKQHPEFADRFRTLNCVTDRLDQKFDFIYAVAVVHMLVEDADRDDFYAFIREQLTDRGIALICTMAMGIWREARISLPPSSFRNGFMRNPGRSCSSPELPIARYPSIRLSQR